MLEPSCCSLSCLWGGVIQEPRPALFCFLGARSPLYPFFQSDPFGTIIATVFLFLSSPFRRQALLIHISYCFLLPSFLPDFTLPLLIYHQPGQLASVVCPLLIQDIAPHQYPHSLPDLALQATLAFLDYSEFEVRLLSHMTLLLVFSHMALLFHAFPISPVLKGPFRD